MDNTIYWKFLKNIGKIRITNENTSEKRPIDLDDTCIEKII